MLAIASIHLKLNHEANHDVSGAHQDGLQKIDCPVIMTGYSQQDFGFSKKSGKDTT